MCRRRSSSRGRASTIIPALRRWSGGQGDVGAEQLGGERCTLVHVFSHKEFRHVATGPGFTANHAANGLAKVEQPQRVVMRYEPARAGAGACHTVTVRSVSFTKSRLRPRRRACRLRDSLARCPELRAPSSSPRSVRRDVGVGNEYVGEKHLVELGAAGDLPQGAHLTPGAVMSMIMVVMPACLGGVGSVRTVARPRWQLLRHAGPHLLPVDLPSTFDPARFGS